MEGKNLVAFGFVFGFSNLYFLMLYFAFLARSRRVGATSFGRGRKVEKASREEASDIHCTHLHHHHSCHLDLDLDLEFKVFPK